MSKRSALLILPILSLTFTGQLVAQTSGEAAGPLVLVVHGMGEGNRPDGWARSMEAAWKIGKVTEVTFRSEFHDRTSYIDAGYLAGPWARDVQQQMQKAIADNPGRPVVIVSHSWGTMATALALKGGSAGGDELEPLALGSRHVAQWVTLGSPLGMDLAKLWKVQVPPGRPYSVDHWTNVYDVSDPVSRFSHDLAGADNVEVSGSGGWKGYFDPTGVTAHAGIWTHPTVTKLLRDTVQGLDDATPAVPVAPPAKPASTPATTADPKNGELDTAKAEADAAAALAKAKKKKKTKEEEEKREKAKPEVVVKVEPPPPVQPPSPKTPAPVPKTPAARTPAPWPQQSRWDGLGDEGRKQAAAEDEARRQAEREAELLKQVRVSLRVPQSVAPGGQGAIRVFVIAPAGLDLAGRRVRLSVSPGHTDDGSVRIDGGGYGDTVYTAPAGYNGTVHVTARVEGGPGSATRTFAVGRGDHASAPDVDSAEPRPSPQPAQIPPRAGSTPPSSSSPPSSSGSTSGRTADSPGGTPAIDPGEGVVLRLSLPVAAGSMQIAGDGTIAGTLTVKLAPKGSDGGCPYESTGSTTYTLTGAFDPGTRAFQGSFTSGGDLTTVLTCTYQEISVPAKFDYALQGEGRFSGVLRADGSLDWKSQEQFKAADKRNPKVTTNQLSFSENGTWSRVQ